MLVPVEKIDDLLAQTLAKQAHRVQRAFLKQFEIRREAPVKTFYRFGPALPVDYANLTISERETPRPTRYAILDVEGVEVDVLPEMLPPGAECGHGLNVYLNRAKQYEAP
jgi:hypothetical protein